jgi:hypothetical protein
MVITPYNNHCWLLSPGPWSVSTTKAYSGVGADIVMESFHSLARKKAKEKRTLVQSPDFAN